MQLAARHDAENSRIPVIPGTANQPHRKRKPAQPMKTAAVWETRRSGPPSRIHPRVAVHVHAPYSVLDACRVVTGRETGWRPLWRPESPVPTQFAAKAVAGAGRADKKQGRSSEVCQGGTARLRIHRSARGKKHSQTRQISGPPSRALFPRLMFFPFSERRGNPGTTQRLPESPSLASGCVPCRAGFKRWNPRF